MSEDSKPSWNEEGVWREWTELWNYDMTLVRKEKNLRERKIMRNFAETFNIMEFKSNSVLSWAIVTIAIVTVLNVIVEVVEFTNGVTLDGGCAEGSEVYYSLQEASGEELPAVLWVMCKECAFFLVIEIIPILLFFLVLKGVLLLTRYAWNNIRETLGYE